MRPASSQPDDGPEPYRTTPRRLSRQIRDRAVECADLAIRIRELAAFINKGPLDVAVQELLELSQMLSAHSIAVLVGKAEIFPELCDGQYQPERPLLDHIESAPIRRAAEAIAPAVAGRGDTDPAWEEEPLPRPSPAHPAAEPARQAAKRRKASATVNGKAEGGVL